MKDLLTILGLFGAQRSRMLLGGALALIAVLAAIGLLTLAGWFITASALAGIAGVTVGFNLFAPSAGIRAFAVTRTAARYFERLVTHDATLRNLAALRVWFFERAIPLAPARLGGTDGGFRSGDLLSRMAADIDALDAVYLRVLLPSAVAAGVALLAAVFIGIHAPAVALVALPLLALAGVAVPAIAGRLGAAPGRRQLNHLAALRTATVDSVQGLRELLVYQADARQSARILEESDAALQCQRHMGRIAGLSSAAVGLLANLAILATLIIGLWLYQEGALAPPVAVMLVFCVMACFEAVAPLPLAYQMLGATRGAARRVLEVAEAAPAVEEPDREAAVPIPPGNDLAVHGLTFRYPGAVRPALEDLELELPAGRRVAVLGSSGAGKSTLLALLLRFYEPERGSLTLGGVDLRRMRAAAVRRRFGVMSQRTQLFSATIADNLRLGRPEAEDGELWDALAAARLDGFVRRLPEGLETWVGESGVNFSGGQARRLALARLYLKDAPILLLDEPTEGLDAATERAVLEDLAAIAKGRSLLLVTHRPACIALTDEVMVLEQGRVVSRLPSKDFLVRPGDGREVSVKGADRASSPPRSDTAH